MATVGAPELAPHAEGSHFPHAMVARALFVFVIVVAGCSRPEPPASPDGDWTQTADQAAATVVQPADSTDDVNVSDDIWNLAASAIRHVPPDSFPDLPPAIRSALSDQGCMVPQPFHATSPRNIISGEFAAAGQTDHAALCTSGDSAAVVILWGGPVTCPSPIARSANPDFLQVVGPEGIGYSREIGVASMEFILTRAQDYDGPPPPSTDHSGINDAFVEKASVVHYCHDRRWSRLAGVD